MLPGIDHSDFVPICQMRDELKNKYKVDHVDEQLTPDDVEEMYVGHELHRALEELCGDVQFPVLPTSTSKYTLLTAYYTIHDVIICVMFITITESLGLGTSGEPPRATYLSRQN